MLLEFSENMTFKFHKVLDKLPKHIASYGQSTSLW